MHGRVTVTLSRRSSTRVTRIVRPSPHLPRRRSAAALLLHISCGCQPTGTRVQHRLHCSEPSASLSDAFITTATSVGNRVSFSRRTLPHRKTIDFCLLHRCMRLVKRPDQRQTDPRHQAFRHQCEHRHAAGCWQHAAALCAISTLSGCVCAWYAFRKRLGKSRRGATSK